MSQFRARIAVDGDTLTTTRPLNAPEKVTDLFGSVEYAFTSGDMGGVESVDLIVETSEDSETPIADSISTTSSTTVGTADVDEDEA